MFTTVAHRPNFRDTSAISSGVLTAAEFRLTFSAPAWMSWVASARVRMPPPTVNGMNTCSATRRTMSSRMARPSWLAEMSRKTSSSAPWASYRRATSTGSPASRRSRKWVPFTTRPRSTSRQGMMRLVSMNVDGSGRAKRGQLAAFAPRQQVPPSPQPRRVAGSSHPTPDENCQPGCE
jgi:hypothetical protein